MKTRLTGQSRRSRRPARRNGTPRVAPGRARLTLETLEDRLVMSTVGVPPAPDVDDASAQASLVSVANEANSRTTLVSVRSLSSTRALLRFHGPVGDNASLASTYAVPGLNVLRAKVSADARSVILTTSPQKAVRYVVKFNELEGADGKLVAPGGAAGRWTGQDGVAQALSGAAAKNGTVLDRTPPRLFSAASPSSRSLVLRFSERLHESALNPKFFTITAVADASTDDATDDASAPADAALPKSLRVRNAVFVGDSGRVVKLTTDVQKDIAYTVVVGKVRDAAGNAMPAPAALDWQGTPVPDTTDPRVVGAVSSGNKTVLVSFSEPMGDSALNPSFYSIVQANVNPEAGFLRIDGAAFHDANANKIVDADERDTVELTTMSQAELTYTVAVISVKDLAGNSLAPPVLASGQRIDPTRADFAGTPPTGDEATDTDGDGLLDHEEQRGWIIAVTRTDGTVHERGVTSNPTNPDSDGDGLTDYQELTIGLDPRTADTDADQLTDAKEFNSIYSDPAAQDSDGDGLDDGIEFSFFHTSAIHADTDGDQTDDGAEIIAGNRDTLIADLPAPDFRVGAITLDIDVRHRETTATETRTLDEKHASATMQQSQSNEFATQLSHNIEASLEIATGYEGGDGGRGKGFISVTGRGAFSHTWGTTDTDRTEATSAYEDAHTTQKERSDGATVETEVFGATMKASVYLKSASNVAFTVTNLQVAAFMQDPQDPSKLTPVATLLPESDADASFTLGPLVPERGPIIFSNTTVFPDLVARLMNNPQGLVFQIVNYDITDEEGRHFAFISQDVNERTGVLGIDFGGFDADNDGVGESTEVYRVAVNTGRPIADTNGDGRVSDADERVVFDDAGKPVGITLREALATIGLTHYHEFLGAANFVNLLDRGAPLDQIKTLAPFANRVQILDLGGAAAGTFKIALGGSLVSGQDPVAFNISQHELRDLLAPHLTGVSVVGFTGVGFAIMFPSASDHPLLAITSDETEGAGVQIHSASLGAEEVQSSYSTFLEDGVERIYRIRGTAQDDLGKRFWRVIAPTGEINPDLGLDDLIIRAGQGVDIGFVRDLDGDLLPAGLEFQLNTSDVKTDTDDDGLDDRFEAFVGWDVDISGAIAHVFSSPSLKDSDRDGLSDFDEAPARLFGENNQLLNINPNAPGYSGANAPLILRAERAGSGDFITNPLERDTDRDEIADNEEVGGFDMTLRDATELVGLKTNPNERDTDGDTAPDGLERRLGGDPTDALDRDTFADDDGDGLANIEETDGWEIVVHGVSTGALQEGGVRTFWVTSDPFNRDTDGDGLTDREEHDLGTTPGLLNAKIIVSSSSSYAVHYHPETHLVDIAATLSSSITVVDTVDLRASTGGIYFGGSFSLDLSDIARGRVALHVNNEPGDFVIDARDTDNDGLSDFEEVKGFVLRDEGIVRTDPTDADTDNDKRSDGDEAELQDIEAKRWYVTVFGQAPRRVFSQPWSPTMTTTAWWMATSSFTAPIRSTTTPTVTAVTTARTSKPS